MYFCNYKKINFMDDNLTGKKIELLNKLLPYDFDNQYICNYNKYTIYNEPFIISKRFNMIVIMFMDIVNYTSLAKKFDDEIIFKLLHNIYIKLDSIKKKYKHLQKIETIGDAYMTVGDMNRLNNNHNIVIKEMILFSLELIKEIKYINTPNKQPLDIRIGINMGNVSIGILGYKMPRLCVVGNAVNVASRLQSTAEINTIHFSHHIYEQLDEIKFDTKLNIQKNENVYLKNIKNMTTYFIKN
jgi:class 3 adenylate cyclase